MKTENVKWLVENFEPDNKIWKLIEELKSRKQPIEVVDYYNFYLNNKVLDENGMPSKSSFNDNDCVIFQGSIQLALWIKRNKPWVPGVWMDLEKFNCSYFYSYLGDFLFNSDYEFTTIGEYKRRHSDFFKKYGIDDCLFIRPNNGMKTFSGQIFKSERHISDWNYFDMSTRAEDLIVVSSPKIIVGEWRFAIGRGEIIASSMYQHNGKPSQLPGAPKEAYNVVKDIIKIIEKECPIDPMYVVDIALTSDGKYKLMELNSFTSAGLYEMDKKIIVDAVNRIAVEEWAEYNKI